MAKLTCLGDDPGNRPAQLSLWRGDDSDCGFWRAGDDGCDADRLGAGGGGDLVGYRSKIQGNILYDWTTSSFTGTETSTLNELAAAFTSGYEPIVVVRSTPTWAQEISNSYCGRMKDTNMDEFGDFMAALVTELNSVYPTQHVTYYEIWNEPDVASHPQLDKNFYLGCWGEPTEPNFGGKHYADMLKQVTPKVHAADPNAKVLVGGLLLDCDPNNPPPNRTDGCLPSKFIEGILANVTAADFDGIAFHAYDYSGTSYAYSNQGWHTSLATTGPATVAKASYLKSLLAKYHFTGKPLLNTENALVCFDQNGCSPSTYPDFEDAKAAYVAETYATAIAQGLLANIWYNVTGQWKDNGLVSVPGLTPLPAYDAYKFASLELQGVTPGGSISRYAGVHGYEFRKTDRQIWLLWSADGLEHNISPPAPPLAIYAVDGAPLPTLPDGRTECRF